MRSLDAAYAFQARDPFNRLWRLDGGVEDALMRFVVEGGRVRQVRMKAFSPVADFSYDDHHLDVAPVD
jgi:hypothetical protein